ncbi:branched-chain amino acid transport system ATP-binding protein [Halogranum amylolyticum]|uniref:Branched-chain amino acid transport system ATP-binding protein n=1 Tax=Halogranum amylolyticum TaxID=660520 RepID=A0A1H8W7U4_9EURY|nr:ABC transporter ATP-binding protein [Halogranum amylolyticum]SEP23724.1 branched-chain amino acid transport system ATP-binding protein [Halogranum amylolyticum]
MSDPLLELRDVEAGYGETQVLEGVSLDVHAGETVALVGRNGVGKTTTLRSILGAVTPTGGRISYDGEEITAIDPVETVRRGVGIVPEERRVFPGLSVEENLRIGSYGGSDTPNRRSVDEVLDTFENLSRRRESRGVDLSGGEQQMLSIGRALVAGADLLMLDEPTEGLAPLIVERVVDLVEEINDEGITVLLVEQNVAVALELADRVYILDKGTVVYEGTPAELEADERILDRYLGVSV